MPSWMSMVLQDSASFTMVELSFLHDYIMSVMVLVIFLISYIMLLLLLSTKFYKFLSEGTLIETIWSIVPAMLLMLLVSPSMKILYFMEDVKLPFFSYKVVAHQWYWSYIVPFFHNLSFKLNDYSYTNFEFDSIMESYSVSSDSPRLLGSTESLFVPLNTTSRLLVTSSDVIHSFSLPSLGLKVDAFPGRLNQLYVCPSRLGFYFGQCSEICGSNHSFMPISFKVCSLSDLLSLSQSYLLDSILEDMDVVISDVS